MPKPTTTRDFQDLIQNQKSKINRAIDNHIDSLMRSSNAFLTKSDIRVIALRNLQKRIDLADLSTVSLSSIIENWRQDSTLSKLKNAPVPIKNIIDQKRNVLKSTHSDTSTQQFLIRLQEQFGNLKQNEKNLQNPKLHKEFFEKLEKLPNSDDYEISNQNHQDIQNTSRELKTHLQNVQRDLLELVDSRYHSAEVFMVGNERDGVDFKSKPSDFLKKAYVVQEYDQSGVSLENRNQPYINAGSEYAKYYDSPSTHSQPSHEISSENKLAFEVSRLHGQINTIISQLNKLEVNLNKKDFDYASLNLVQSHRFVKIFLQLSEESQAVQILPKTNKIIDAIKKISSKLESIINSISQTISQNFNNIKNELKNSKSSHQSEPTESNVKSNNPGSK